MRLLLSLSMLICIFSYGQNSAGKIYNATTLKKGFYKSYEEYLNNAPTINKDFTVKYTVVKKEDTTVVISADYVMTNKGEAPGNFWGFCDGKDVFIQRSVGIADKKNYRAIHIGILPMYYTMDNVGRGGWVGIIVDAMTTAVAEKDLTLTVIDEKERKLLVKEGMMKSMILTDYPDLLKSFKEAMEAEKNNKSIKFNDQAKERIYQEYIIKLDKLKQGAK